MATMDPATETMIRNLEARTGRSLADWTALVAASGIERHAAILAHLKTEHGLTHGYANLVAHTARAAAAPPADDPVVAQYAGAKAALRPIHDRLLAAVRAFGDDVEVAPKKANVSLRRRKQFALVQPSTASRVDVGLNLGDVPPSGRLEASGSFSAMVTHRVRVESADAVDAELVGWLRQAYDRA